MAKLMMRWLSVTAVMGAFFMLLASCGGGSGSPLPGPGGNPAPTAQFGSVSGTLTNAGLVLRGASQVDPGANQPLPDVSVDLNDQTTGDTVGSTTTDAGGNFEFGRVPAGDNFDVQVSLDLQSDLNGDGQPDNVQLDFPVTVTPGQTSQVDQAIGLGDANGDGTPDSVDVEGNVQDSTGVHQEHSRHNENTGETQVDTNNDGSFDQSVTDSDADGVGDATDTDADNDGISNGSDSDSNGNGTPDSAEFEAKGAIEALTDTSITIGGVTYTFDTNTIFLNENGDAITPADLAVGTFVEVMGTTQADGSMLLSKVKIETQGQDAGGSGGTGGNDNGTGDVNGGGTGDGTGTDGSGGGTGDNGGSSTDTSFDASGAIEAMTDTTITIGGVTYTFDANTVFLNEVGAALTPADFAVGDFVEVQGTTQADGSTLLTEVQMSGGGQDTGGSGSDGSGDGSGTGDSGGDGSGTGSGGN